MNEDNFERSRGPSGLERLLGDRPGALIVRLVVLSLLVGFVMQAMGLSVPRLFDSLRFLLSDAFADSAQTLRGAGSYVATGAAIVVPVWLLLRLTSRRGRR